jgi:hypothetical protein
MGRYEKARSLFQQVPGQRRDLVNVSYPLNIAVHRPDCHQETSDSFDKVVVALDQEHRVITCRDGIQWILQRRKNGGAERPWRAFGYFRTRAALIRLCASLNGRIDPNAMAILMALPDMIGGAA